MREEIRRTGTLVLCVVAWLASFGLGLYAGLTFDPTQGHFAPSWFTPTEILLIGVAIASGTALGRLRSVETLTKVFQAGTVAGERKSGGDEGE